MSKYFIHSLVIGLLLFTIGTGHATDTHRWWDDAWWESGTLETPANHPVQTEREYYRSGDIEVPVLVARPADRQAYPAVLFVHGRRGVDELVSLHVKRLAARGFVVFAPDLYEGRFIEVFPIEHDYTLEDDLNAGLDVLLARNDIIGKHACAYSHTRGGYYALKVAVSQQRQHNGLACYVSYYPHMQDPNAPEPMQVYRYANEANDLTIPTLIFIGEHEQYQRRRGIEMAVNALREREHPAQLVVYPGVGRGFDFRDPSVRTFADDLASKDAIQRASRFMLRQLSVGQ